MDLEIIFWLWTIFGFILLLLSPIHKSKAGKFRSTLFLIICGPLSICIILFIVLLILMECFSKKILKVKDDDLIIKGHKK